MAEVVELNPKTENYERSSGLDEQRIVNTLEANVIEADVIQGSEVSEQRQRNHQLYAIDPLGNERKNRSDHISADVFDQVESNKAFYQEAFTSNRRPVYFSPQGPQDRFAKAATEYVHMQFMDKNDGYGFLRDSFHDAMVAKRCVAKVEWQDAWEVQRQEFKGLTQQQIMQLSQMEEVQRVETTGSEPGPNGQMLISGIVDIEVDISHCDLELVQPERYFRDPNVSFVHEAAFAGYQEDLPRYELIDRGHDETEVMELNIDYRFRQGEEDAARKAHDSSWSRARRHKREPEQEIVTVYWHWAILDLSKYETGSHTQNDSRKGRYDSISSAQLYKFCWSQGRLLTLPETMEFDDQGNMTKGATYVVAEDEMPFFEWTQYKIAHSEFGLCEADIQTGVQRTKSNLTRLIIDNQAMANTSRWKAKHGFIKNPRELLDNNIGSVLWVKDMKALEPLDTPSLRPESFALLELLDKEKENRGGLSSLAKGMNTDAISNQNSSDMIQRLTNASNRRVLRGVRDYAVTFLSPIFLYMYMLGVKYDTQTHNVTVQGQYLQLKPEQWGDRSIIKVKVALTPDEAREHAMFLTSMHSLMSGDEDLRKMYGPPQKFAMISEIFELMDAGQASQFLDDPSSKQYQQKIKQEQKMQAMQQKIQDLQIRFQTNEDRRQTQEQDRKVADTATDNLRADDELAHKQYMEEEELKLERSTGRSVQIG